MEQVYSAMLHFLDQDLEGLRLDGFGSAREARDAVLAVSGYERLPSDARLVVWRRPANIQLVDRAEVVCDFQGSQFDVYWRRATAPPDSKLFHRVAEIVQSLMADGQWRWLSEVMEFVAARVEKPAPNKATYYRVREYLGIEQRVLGRPGPAQRGARWRLAPQRVTPSAEPSPEGAGTEG